MQRRHGIYSMPLEIVLTLWMRKECLKHLRLQADVYLCLWIVFFQTFTTCKMVCYLKHNSESDAAAEHTKGEWHLGRVCPYQDLLRSYANLMIVPILSLTTVLCCMDTYRIPPPIHNFIILSRCKYDLLYFTSKHHILDYYNVSHTMLVISKYIL